MSTSNSHVAAWIEEMAKAAQPDQVVWCSGSEEEAQKLTDRESVEIDKVLAAKEKEIMEV